VSTMRWCSSQPGHLCSLLSVLSDRGAEDV
jgi:hypothetical protein